MRHPNFEDVKIGSGGVTCLVELMKYIIWSADAPIPLTAYTLPCLQSIVDITNQSWYSFSLSLHTLLGATASSWQGVQTYYPESREQCPVGASWPPGPRVITLMWTPTSLVLFFNIPKNDELPALDHFNKKYKHQNGTLFIHSEG